MATITWRGIEFESSICCAEEIALTWLRGKSRQRLHEGEAALTNQLMEDFDDVPDEVLVGDIEEIFEAERNELERWEEGLEEENNYYRARGW